MGDEDLKERIILPNASYFELGESGLLKPLRSTLTEGGPNSNQPYVVRFLCIPSQSRYYSLYLDTGEEGPVSCVVVSCSDPESPYLKPTRNEIRELPRTRFWCEGSSFEEFLARLYFDRWMIHLLSPYLLVSNLPQPFQRYIVGLVKGDLEKSDAGLVLRKREYLSKLTDVTVDADPWLCGSRSCSQGSRNSIR